MSERTPKRHALMHVASTAVFLATAVTLLLVPSSARAQDTPDFRAEFKGQFEASARKFVALSEAMPAETYAWSPMEGVMTVARVYRHVARYNYMYPHLNLGIDPPKGVDYRTLEDGGTDKDEVVEPAGRVDGPRAGRCRRHVRRRPGRAGGALRPAGGQLGGPPPARHPHERAPRPVDRIRPHEQGRSALVQVGL